jgi:hypothetical protein
MWLSSHESEKTLVLFCIAVVFIDACEISLEVVYGLISAFAYGEVSGSEPVEDEGDAPPLAYQRQTERVFVQGVGDIAYSGYRVVEGI